MHSTISRNTSTLHNILELLCCCPVGFFPLVFWFSFIFYMYLFLQMSLSAVELLAFLSSKLTFRWSHAETLDFHAVFEMR